MRDWRRKRPNFLAAVVYLDWGGGYTESVHLSKFIEHFDSVIYKWHLKTENIIFKRIFSMSKSSTKNLHIANEFVSKVCLPVKSYLRFVCIVMKNPKNEKYSCCIV